MSILKQFLKRFGLMPNTERDEALNASMASKSQELDDVIGKLRDHLNKKNASVAHLRESITRAQERTHAFEDFEKLTIRRSRSKGSG